MVQDQEVAILFADVVGSTQLYDEFGDTKASETVAICLDVMKDSTQQFNGTVIKTIGDEVMATFPTVDDAMGAASMMQTQLSGEESSDINDIPVSIRIGCHFGPVVHEKNDIFGAAVHTANRITERSSHIAEAMRRYLPEIYSQAIDIILKSLTPPLEKTEGNGLAPMFYMPHCSYIAKYGVDSKYNDGVDPFECSIQAQYELTKRFTCEFSIRHFIIHDERRTMDVLLQWMNDENPHVRRLCSEGTRPRLPWAMKIDSFVKDPTPAIPILEQLKNDPDLYVRRDAGHVGSAGLGARLRGPGQHRQARGDQ